MIHFGYECDKVKDGLSFHRISDGGLSIWLRIGNKAWKLRERGWKNPCKPKFLFERYNESI